MAEPQDISEDIRTQFERSAVGIETATTTLKELRRKLDAGEISVSAFIQQGQPLAEQTLADIGVIAGQGAGAASSVNPFISQLKSAGFLQTGGAGETPIVEPRLPQKFERQAREELIPANITGEQRERLLATIPFDIPIGSERFEIEREKVRQQVGAEQQLEQRGVKREEQLTQLEQILQQQQERSFKEATPILTEQLQTGGLLQTSELESAFAREQARLTGRSQEVLAGERLRAGELGIGEELDIQQAARRFQSAGLQREFSLADFQREAQLSRQLADLTRPRGGGGKGGGGAISGAIGGAAALGGLGAAIPGIGTAGAVGLAGLGLVAGAAAGR